MKVKILLTILFTCSCIGFAYLLGIMEGERTIEFKGTVIPQTTAFPFILVDSETAYAWEDSYLTCHDDMVLLYRYNELGQMEYYRDFSVNSPFSCYGESIVQGYKAYKIVLFCLLVGIIFFLIIL